MMQTQPPPIGMEFIEDARHHAEATRLGAAWCVLRFMTDTCFR